VTGYVVVTFGGPSGACDLSHCPMTAYGPFPTSSEARKFAGTFPEWTRPHVVSVENPTDDDDAPSRRAIAGDARHLLVCRRVAYRVRRATWPYLHERPPVIGSCPMEEGPLH